MRYLCVHCDHRFEAEGTDVPKRCPSCMRAKGIEPVRDDAAKAPASAAKGRAKHLVWLVVLALGAGAAVWFTRPKATLDPNATGPVPMDADAMKESLAAARVDAGGLERLLLSNDAIEDFAEKASAGKEGPRAKAEAIYKALRDRARASAFVSWSLGEPRSTPVMTAVEAWKQLKDGARVQLYPLEAAALGVAALRALEVPALVAELSEVAGRKAPLDPSGYLGYFVVAVYPETPGVGAPLLFDVFGGLGLNSGAQAQVLSDTSAVGAALALRALHENTYLADPKRALESTSHALSLAGRLPSVRTVRGVVVLTERMIEQGLQEFQAARELRPDAPRLHNVASVMLVTGEVEKAQGVLSSALEKAPDFAAAHATLGTLLLMQGQSEEAHVELTKAERMAPDLSLVQWGLADYAIRSGDRDEAIARARKALEARPSFDAKLRFAALLRQAAKYEEMRTLAAQMLAQVPAYRKDEIRNVLLTVLGPTALEPEQPTTVDPSADDLSDLGGPDLKLQMPDKGEGAPLSGRLNSGRDAKRLQLRDPSEQLRLGQPGQ